MVALPSNPSILSRRRACLYGLAIGDALGAAVEFKARGTFEPVTGYRGGGPHGINAGEWTDDTSMALALAAAISVDPFDGTRQLREYLAWRNEGRYSVNGRCFDIGGTVSGALHRFASGTPPTECASKSPTSSGNGCIMRLAPVPILATSNAWLDGKNNRADVDLSDISCQTTHGSEICRIATGALDTALQVLILGKVSKEDLPAKIRTYYREFTKVTHSGWDGLYVDKPMDCLHSSGYVIHTLEAALWCFHHGQSFEEVVLTAVNLGGNADTIGAVAGQLAGAYYGMEEIPDHLRRGLARCDMIEEALEKLDAGVGSK